MISILTPSWNYGHFIGDALESVSVQDVTHQHLVADNESADATHSVLREYSSRSHGQLRWWSRRDAGQSDALNTLLSASSEPYIGWLNADEYYAPGALSSALDMFAARPDIDVVYGDTLFVDGSGRLQRLLARHPYDPFVLKHRGCYISTCAAFVRRDALQGFAFDVSLRQVMDWDFFLYLERRGSRFHYLPQVLGVFRAHDARVTAVPTARDGPEHSRVRRRYGLTTQAYVWRVQRALGDGRYAWRKALTGATARERAASTMQGATTLWMHCTDARRTFSEIERR